MYFVDNLFAEILARNVKFHREKNSKLQAIRVSDLIEMLRFVILCQNAFGSKWPQLILIEYLIFSVNILK